MTAEKNNNVHFANIASKYDTTITLSRITPNGEINDNIDQRQQTRNVYFKLPIIKIEFALKQLLKMSVNKAKTMRFCNPSIDKADFPRSIRRTGIFWYDTGRD